MPGKGISHPENLPVSDPGRDTTSGLHAEVTSPILRHSPETTNQVFLPVGTLIGLDNQMIFPGIFYHEIKRNFF